MSDSFPAIFQDQYSLKGFYRFINTTQVSHQDFMQGYQKGLEDYSKSVSEQGTQDPWLLLQDTMFTDYNGRKVDLGYTETPKSNGLIVHNGLLLDETYAPIGLLHQQIISRKREEFGKRQKQKSLSMEEKESFKWVEGLRSGECFSQQTGRDLIHVIDREGDITELINCFDVAHGQYYVIRSRHDRSFLSTQQREGKSPTFLEQNRLRYFLDQKQEHQLVKRQLRDEKGKNYEAECLLKFSLVELRGITSSISCVFLQEKSDISPTDKTAEWILLTNLEVNTFEQAEFIVDLYTKRWTIEDYHKCLKTGCSIEKRQFNSVEGLSSMIGLFGLLAVALLRSRYFAKMDPQANIEKVIQDESTLKLAPFLAEKYLKPVDLKYAQPNTALWWLLLLGRMGGHQGIAQKGLPGWQTLWKGYQFLNTVLLGYKANDPHIKSG